MAETVYIMPGVARSARYGDQFRVHAEPGLDGGPMAETEALARVPITVSGTVHTGNYPDLRIFLNRMRGGLGVAGLIDYAMRQQYGWDRIPAVDSAGNELWRASGATAAYAGEAANPPTGPWRSIFAQAAGAHAADATSLSLDQLLAGEVIPKGCALRIGDWRYMSTAAATADAFGAATVPIDQGLRAALADNDPVRIPGDFVLARLWPGQELMGAIDLHRRGSFELEFVEVYAGEISGGVGSYVLP